MRDSVKLPARTPQTTSDFPLDRNRAVREDFEPPQPRLPFALPAHDAKEQEVDETLRRTRELVSRWAPHLGLQPSTIALCWDPGMQQQLAARRLLGLMQAGRLHLNRARYEADAELGRFVLAHELVHLAQRSERAVHPGARRGSPAGAEREADRLARGLVLHDRAARPRVLLPGGAVAAKEDAPHAPKLGELVVQTRQRELEEIRSYLETGLFDWAITDGDIDNIFRILEPLAFVLIRAISRALDFKERHKVVSEISPGHFKRFRRPIFAFYTGMDQWEFNFAPEDPFEGASLEGLAREEAYGAHYIATNLQKQRPTWKPKPQHRRMLQKLQSAEYAATLGEIAADLEEAEKEEQKREAAIGQERAKAQEGPLKDKIGRFLAFATKKLSRSFTDWAVTDREALAVLDALSAFLNDAALMRGAVEGLQQLDLLDRFLENIPVETLYLETPQAPEMESGIKDRVNRRRVLLRVLAYRQPHKNVHMAESLLKKGFFIFDWVVTDEEAFFAFQLLKVVPPPAREAFFAAEGGKQAKVLFEELSLSMKEGPTMNFYSGGEGGADLMALQQQLLDERLWNESGRVRLEGLLRLAIAAGEHEWVFSQSKWRYQTSKPYQSECEKKVFRAGIVDKFGLYYPGVREVFDDKVAKPLSGKPFGSDNIFATIGQALDFIGASKHPWQIVGKALFSESIGGEGLNFGEFQDITGGSLLGAKFERIDKVDDATREELLDNIVQWDLDRGVIQMRASKVLIESIHYPMANLKIQAGKTAITGLYLHIQYPAPESPPGGAHTVIRLRMDFAQIEDLALIGPGSMTSINQVLLRDALVELKPEGASIGKPRNEIAWGNIFFTPLFNIIKMTGLDLQGIPILSPLSVTSASDRLAQGLQQPNTPLDVKVMAGQIKVSGLATSSGQFVDEIDLHDLSLRSTQGRAGYKKWLQQEIARLENEGVALGAKTPDPKSVSFPTRRTVEIQLKSVRAELAGIEQAEAERRDLEQRQKTGQISPEDQRKLARLRDYLDHLDDAGRGGVAADIGTATVKGVGGKVAMGDLSLKELHGHGRSAGAVLGFLFDSAAMNRLLRGPDYKPVIQGVEEEDPSFALRFQDLTLQQVDVPGDIPTAEQADKEYDKILEEAAVNPFANDIGLEIRFLRARRRKENAHRYWLLADLALHTPQELTEKEVQEFQRLREDFRNQKKFHAATISFGPGALEIGHTAGTGTTQFSVFGENLEMTQVSAGELTANRIHGRQARIGAQFSEGLAGLLKNPRRAMRAGGLTADELTIEGVSHEQYGHLFDRLSLTKGVTAGIEQRGNKIEAGAGMLSVEGFGISPRLQLLRQRMIRLQLRSPRTPEEDGQLQKLKADIAWMEGYLRQRREAYQKWVAAKTPEEKAAAQTVMDESDTAAVLLLAEYGAAGLVVNELGVRVTGLGDIFSENFDLDAALGNGIQIEGSGPQQRFLKSATVSGLHAKTDDKEGQMVGRAEKAELGEMRGKIEYSKSQIKFTNLTLESLSLSNFLLTALGGKEDTGHQVYSNGATTFTGLRLTGELNFTLRQTADPTGKENVGDYRLSHIHIQDFGIKKIAANELNYRHLGSKIHVTLHSGSLEDVYVNDLNLFLPEDPKTDLVVTGEAGIKAIRDLEVQAALPGGFELQRARLNGGGLTLNLLSDGERQLSLGDLSLAAGSLRGPDGWARFSFDHLRGDIIQKGDLVQFKKIRLDDITVSRFKWKAGNGEVRSSGLTTFHGLWLNAELRTKKEKNPKTGEESTVISSVKVSHLHVDKVTSEHLVYQAGDLTIEVRRPASRQGKEEPPPLQIESIDLRDLLWEPKKGIRNWKLDIVSARADFVTSFKEDIKLNTELTATGLHAALRRDGKLIASIDELTALTEGKVKGVQVKAKASRAKTGPITFSPDENKIEMPSFVLPSLELLQLSYDGEKFKIDVPEGTGGATMKDIEAGLVVNLNPPPKKGTPPDLKASRIKNVTINTFKVPTTSAKGLTFMLKDPTDPITITVDKDKPAVLSQLELKPKTPFVFTPKGESWDYLGSLTLNSADASQIGLDIGKSINAHADVKAKTFSLDFLGAGKTCFKIATVTAEEIRGKLGNGDFNLTTKGGSKFQGEGKPKPGVTFTGIGKSEEGEFTVGGIGVYGFVYDDRAQGLHLDVREALLKKKDGSPLTKKDGSALTVEEGEITVPKVEINDAYFKIDDVLKLGGGKAGPSALSYAPDMALLNNLDGHVNFDIDLQSNKITDHSVHVRVGITDGRVNFKQVEDSLGNTKLNWAVDFKVDEKSVPAKLFIGIGAKSDDTKIQWDLTPEELELARSKQVRITTLVNPPTVISPPPDPKDDPLRVTSMRYKDANIDLHMPNKSKIVLGNAGEIELGGNTKSDNALRLSAQHKGYIEKGSPLAFDIEAHVSKTDLKISGGDKRLRIDQIHIDGLKDAHLDFESKEVSPGINIDVPKTLEGTLSHASAENIRITPEKKSQEEHK
jgi:Fe-S cluster assembly iron-binding protein IscA